MRRYHTDGFPESPTTVSLDDVLLSLVILKGARILCEKDEKRNSNTE